MLQETVIIVLSLAAVLPLYRQTTAAPLLTRRDFVL